MNKYMMFLGYVAGIIMIVFSMMCTYMLFESFVSGSWFGKALGLVGISIDIGKLVCASVFIYMLSKGNNGMAVISLLFYLGCFSISMIASQSLDLNKANVIKQESILASDIYKLNLDSYETNKKEIARISSELSTLKNNKDTEIEKSLTELKEKRDYAKSKNWITTPSGSPRDGVDVWDKRISTRQAEKEAEIDSRINNLETQLGTYRNLKESAKTDLSNIGDSKILATEGMLAFASWVHSMGIGESPENILGTFYLLKNVFAELLGTFLVMISTTGININIGLGGITGIIGAFAKITKKVSDIKNLKKEKELRPKTDTLSLNEKSKQIRVKKDVIGNIISKIRPKQEPLRPKETIVSLKAPQSNGVMTSNLSLKKETPRPKESSLRLKKISTNLVNQNKEFIYENKEFIIAYLKAAQNPSNLGKDGQIPGITKISKQIGVTESKAKSIYAFLKTLKIIESKQRKSYIKMRKKDYKKLLNLGDDENE
jgi:hypothetical protein